MDNILRLEDILEFQVKKNWKLFCRSLEFNDLEYQEKNIEQVMKELLPKLKILNDDFAMGAGIYLSWKKEYETLEQMGFLRRDYGNSFGLTGEGGLIIDTYRKYENLLSVEESKRQIYRRILQSVEHLRS